MQVHSFSWVHSIEFSLITMAIPEVHATLSADKIASIMADLDDVQKQLDFLIGLTPDERREIPKMGIKQHDFVTHSLATTWLRMAVTLARASPKSIRVLSL
jgi:hypothetical protein